MSGPARASGGRGPRSARQGGVYSLHTRGRRALCLGAVCLAGLLMAACMHTVLSAHSTPQSAIFRLFSFKRHSSYMI